MLTTILVPLDGSSLGERALPYATALARSAEARLILLHAKSSLGATHEQMSELAAADELACAADRVRADGIVVETCVYPVHDEDFGRAIVAGARERQADLLVMSTHGRGGLGRWLYGSVADEVVRQADRPVLLIPSACEQSWPEDRAWRILVPLDGLELAEAALGPAGQLAEQLGATLVLLRAVGPIEHASADGVPYLLLDPEAEVAAAREYLEAIAGKLRAAGRNVELYADAGNPASLIAKVTREQGIDLIAMATHGRSGLARLALGSVATETLHRARVPLLLVRAVAMHQPRTVVNATGLEAGPSARKAVPIADLQVNDAVTAPTGVVVDADHGMQVAVGEAARLVLYVTNVGPSAGVVTVLAGDPRCAPHAGTGDLHIRIPPGSGRLVGPLGASRFVRQDGTLWLDFTPDLAGTIVAYRLPRDT